MLPSGIFFSFLTAPSGKRIEYQGGPLLPEEANPCQVILTLSCKSKGWDSR